MNFSRIILQLTLVILYASVQAQPIKPSKQISNLNKEIFNNIKKNSLFTDKINWEDVSKQSKAIVFTEKDSLNEQMLYDFYTNKLRAVGDKHSFFISSKRISTISNTPVTEIPQGEYLGDGIAWIKVPRLMTFDEKKDIEFTNTIRNNIEKIDTENDVKGWIVDLRHNGGGNMWPMLAGLNALIDDGTAGYFVQAKTKIPWINENGKIMGKNQSFNSYKIKNNKVKIAVLFDARTGSSGEMTAVSFLGLPNVKSFGQTTSGYTTANYTIQLSNGAQLLLAKTYIMDRSGKSYMDVIVPDVTVNDLSNTKNDEVIKAAIKWLSQ